jgi:integrase
MSRLYKRGEIYYFDISKDGQRLRQSTGTSNKSLAQTIKSEIEAKITLGKFDIKPEEKTIERIFAAFDEYSKTNHRSSTVDRYRCTVRNFQIFLALNYPNITKPSQLKPALVEKYKSYRKNTNPRKLKLPRNFPIEIPHNCHMGQPRTINFELKTLKAIFAFGIKQEMCGANPLDKVTYFKITRQKAIKFLSHKECEKLLDHADSFRPVFFTFLNTGLRLGELINLRWNDIDMKRRRLIVQAKADWQPKSSEREIPLNDGMMSLLYDIKPKRIRKKEYVFTYTESTRFTKKGRKLKPRFLRNQLIRIAKSAGIDELTRIHDLRHTFASQLVMAGVDLPTVRELLGHSDIQTTMIYAHLAPDHLAGAVNKLDFNLS